MLMFIVSVLAAYAVGSFPTSFLMAKAFKGIDIRQVGSKNAGATNVFRAVGKMPALATLVIDIYKGVFVVTVLAGFFYPLQNIFNYDFYRPLLGFIAVCGHIWPVFLKFRGGKGVATTLGMAAVLAPKAFLASAAIFVIVFSLSGYISLASIISLLSFPLIAAVFNYSFYLVVFSVTISLIVSYKHKENIKRLLKGVENKTVIFKPKNYP